MAANLFAYAISASIILLVGCAPPRPQVVLSSTESNVDSQVIASGECHAKGVKQVNVAYDPVSPTHQFTYHYQHQQIAAAGNPTVIYLVGGPGYPGFDTELPGLPSNFGLINIDIRTTGCNNLASGFADKYLRTQLLAQDVIAVIENEKLNNYILYGSSYGTMLATVTAGLIERKAITKPKAILLEGTLGRAFANGETQASFISGWDDVVRSFTPELLKQFSSSPLPLNYTAAEWARIVQWTQVIGKNQDNDYYPDLLKYVGDPEVAKAFQPMFDQVIAPAVGETQGTTPSDRLYKVIGCQEISNEIMDMTLQGARLQRVPANRWCNGLPFSRDKYDSKLWQTTANIYYLQGSRDPATPPWQAKYHFENQRLAKVKSYTLVPDGGHGPSSQNLASCMPQIWSAIDVGAKTLDAALRNCPQATQQAKRR